VAVRVDPREDYRETILAGQESVLVVPARPAAPARRSRQGQDTTLAYTILTPTFAVILGMVAYPFFIGIWLSLQSKMVGAPGRFVGLQNYVELFRNDLFLRTVYNSVVYTVVAVAIKFVLGLTMALVLDQERRFNNFFRTLLFVPWALPVVIVSLSWRWIFDDLSGFLNNFLITFHITNNIISWLSDPNLAMGCVIAVVVWAGTPFYTMTFLAGLQAIPKELYEAAEIDGASIVQQFFYVTIPRLRTIFLTTVMLSTIWTATNLQFVYILTKGGPAGRTEIFPHLSYTLALGAFRLGMGAAVSLVLCSSKTRAEVETIQQALGIHHPFVCESGAATFVPAGYFPFDVPQARDLAGYQAVEFGRPHAEIAQALRRTAARLRVDMVAFGDMSVDEVARDCHLSLLQARLAKLPEYGERFRVRDRRAAARGRLFDALQASHLRCTGGAHFDYVGAPVENSLGVALLRTLYHRAFGAVVTVGLADAMADDNLLQLVDRRVIVGDEDPARGGVDVAAWARAIVDIVEEVRGDRACTGR